MLTIPSHLLISPQALWQALAGDRDSPPDLARIPGMLAEIQSHIEALIGWHDGLIGGDANQVQALRATRNLLAVIREAVGADDVEGQAAREAWRAYHLASTPGDFLVVVTREAHQVLPGTRMQVRRRDGADRWWFAEDESGRQSAPMRAEAACQRLNDWGAQVIVDDDYASHQPDTWLALIDRVLETLAGLGWGPEGTKATLRVVQAILSGHEAPETLTSPVRPGDDRTWLDAIDDALVEAEDLVDFDAGMSEEALGEVHGLVQGILTGHVPLDHLLGEHSLALTPYAEGGRVG
jgi:hypothetical protein